MIRVVGQSVTKSKNKSGLIIDIDKGEKCYRKIVSFRASSYFYPADRNSLKTISRQLTLATSNTIRPFLSPIDKTIYTKLSSLFRGIFFIYGLISVN